MDGADLVALLRRGGLPDDFLDDELDAVKSCAIIRQHGSPEAVALVERHHLVDIAQHALAYRALATVSAYNHRGGSEHSRRTSLSKPQQLAIRYLVDCLAGHREGATTDGVKWRDMGLSKMFSAPKGSTPPASRDLSFDEMTTKLPPPPEGWTHVFKTNRQHFEWLIALKYAVYRDDLIVDDYVKSRPASLQEKARERVADMISKLA